MSPCRYSVTFFERCRATATKPMRSNSAASCGGIGRGVFDELEAVGAHRVVPQVAGHIASCSAGWAPLRTPSGRGLRCRTNTISRRKSPAQRAGTSFVRRLAGGRPRGNRTSPNSPHLRDRLDPARHSGTTGLTARCNLYENFCCRFAADSAKRQIRTTRGCRFRRQGGRAQRTRPAQGRTGKAMPPARPGSAARLSASADRGSAARSCRNRGWPCA